MKSPCVHTESHKSLHLLFVSHTSEIGGAELALLELVRELSGQAHRIDIVLPGPGILGDRLRSAGADVWQIQYGWWAHSGSNRLPLARRVKAYLRSVRGFFRLMQRLTPDVVITQTLTIPWAALAAKAARLPHIWFVHEFGDKDHGLRFDLGARNSARLIGILSDKVMVNSHAVFRHFSKSVPAHKLCILYQGVDVPGDAEPRRPSDDIFKITLVGKLTPSKGQEDAVRAVALLHAKGFKIKLTLMGGAEGEYPTTLRTLARSLEVDTLVDFLGFSEDRLDQLRKAHVALVCSRCEAFGRVTIEAMKLGVPVIGSNRGGTRELIRHGWNGLLYNPHDPAELASRIETLYRDEALRRSLARNAQTWSRSHFSSARYVEDFQEVIAQVLRGRQPPLKFGRPGYKT